jgi:Fic family protein
MTADENIFVAKRNIVDYIYKSARLENIGVTYPDTEAIVNGGLIHGLKTDEIVAINNLKHAWQFVLENIDYPTEYPLICEINRKVGANLFSNPGFMRNIPVSIGGTDWKPQMPIEADIKDEIQAALNIENTTDRSITLMLQLMRRQMFIDGNKRTAMLAANHEMIRSGAGIISIPIERIKAFSLNLINYYETGNIQEIKAFIYENCIDGLDMETARTNEHDQETFDEWRSKKDTEMATPMSDRMAVAAAEADRRNGDLPKREERSEPPRGG